MALLLLTKDQEQVGYSEEQAQIRRNYFLAHWQEFVAAGVAVLGFPGCLPVVNIDLYGVTVIVGPDALGQPVYQTLRYEDVW